YRQYVQAYNTRTDEIKAKAKDVKVGVQTYFDPLAREFGPGSPGIGVIPVIIVIAVIGAIAAGTAYTITEVQRQNKAAETEIKNLDNLLTTFKGLPGADADSLGNFIAKIDYVPGKTPPPTTGITDSINHLIIG